MTQEIVQETDWSAIENAIELWAATGTGLPQLQNEHGKDVPKIRWAGYDLPRIRPFGVLSIINDNSPGRACTKTSAINEGGTDKIKIQYNYKYDWSVQLAIYQSSYDSDGVAIRTTARQYAKNLIDSYQMQPLRAILLAEDIGLNTINKNIQGDVMSGTDSDEYIHQGAVIEFRFNGINKRSVKDSDFFTSIEDPAVNLSGDNAP